MNFIQTKPQQRSKTECIEAITKVINADKLTIEQLNKFVNILEDDSRLKRALIFL